ncbi:ester cyclase [Nocardiopsis sp. CNT312]|uniref:ester cyclase n=1 Tax=Nocardiopsis sp. CNT312 TaxID=1137268 RepID=UPI0004B4D2CC|nr:ester cyclase [Nocardiopsis sp. CNT312]
MGTAADIQREYFAVMRSGGSEEIRRMLHPEYGFTDEEGALQGVDDRLIRRWVFTQAFPDWELTIHRQIEVDGVSVLEGTVTGTHRGPLIDVPASGRRISVGLCNIVDVRDGLILHEREYADKFALLQQVGGVLPAS